MTWTFTRFFAPGEKGQITFAATTKTNLLPDVTEIRNRAHLSTTELNQDTNEVIHYLALPENLAKIDKNADPVPNSNIFAGNKIKYFLNFTNTSKRTNLTNVLLEDTLDKTKFNLTTLNAPKTAVINGVSVPIDVKIVDNLLTLVIGRLDVGAVGQATFEINTLGTLKDNEIIKNSFLLKSDQINLTSNEVIHRIIALPDGLIQKSANPVSGSTIGPSQEILYTLNYENVLAKPLNNPYLTDKLDDNLDPATLEVGPKGIYDSTSRIITWNLGPKLDPGAKGEVNFEIKPKSGLSNGTKIYNHGTLHSNEITVDSNETVHTIDYGTTSPTCSLSLSPNSAAITDPQPITFTATVQIINGGSNLIDPQYMSWSLTGSGSLTPDASNKFIASYKNATKEI